MREAGHQQREREARAEVADPLEDRAVTDGLVEEPRGERGRRGEAADERTSARDSIPVPLIGGPRRIVGALRQGDREGRRVEVVRGEHGGWT